MWMSFRINRLGLQHWYWRRIWNIYIYIFINFDYFHSINVTYTIGFYINYHLLVNYKLLSCSKQTFVLRSQPYCSNWLCLCFILVSVKVSYSFENGDIVLFDNSLLDDFDWNIRSVRTNRYSLTNTVFLRKKPPILQFKSLSNIYNYFFSIKFTSL